MLIQPLPSIFGDITCQVSQSFSPASAAATAGAQRCWHMNYEGDRSPTINHERPPSDTTHILNPRPVAAGPSVRFYTTPQNVQKNQRAGQPVAAAMQPPNVAITPGNAPFIGGSSYRQNPGSASTASSGACARSGTVNRVGLFHGVGTYIAKELLLLLGHAGKCRTKDGQCAFSPGCQAAKRLLQHIPECKDYHCKVICSTVLVDVLATVEVPL